MAQQPQDLLNTDEMRSRRIGPGVFVPFPDSEEAVKEDAREQLRTSTNVDGPEPDEDCDAALSEGLDEQTLNSYEGVRQWVMCKAWEYHRGQNIPFGEAVDRAWSDVSDARE